MNRFYFARSGHNVDYVTGEIQMLRYADGRMVIHYGDQYVGFFDGSDFEREDDANLIVMKLKGTDIQFRFVFTNGTRRTMELWIDGLSDRSPLHVFTAESGLEYTAL